MVLPWPESGQPPKMVLPWPESGQPLKMVQPWPESGQPHKMAQSWLDQPYWLCVTSVTAGELMRTPHMTSVGVQIYACSHVASQWSQTTGNMSRSQMCFVWGKMGAIRRIVAAEKTKKLSSTFETGLM